MNKSVIKVIGAYLEMNGQRLSVDAFEIYCKPFLNQDVDVVEAALDKCMVACKGFIRPVDIIDNMEFADGRPEAAEAWAMMPNDERQTVVWTQEMIECHDYRDYARFQRGYEQAVKMARIEGRPTKWNVSLGWDREARKPVIEEAYRLGRISLGEVKKLGYDEDRNGGNWLAEVA